MNDKRYVIIQNKCDVSIIDTQDNNNLEVFGAFCEDEEGALFLINSLDPMVCLMNEQDRELKKLGVITPSL